MVYAVLVVVSIACLLFLARYLFIKKELRRLCEQLQEIRQQETGQTLHLALYDKDLERLAEEINEQRRATKQAMAGKKRSEQELKQAISNMSHDIRTPMTSILGFIQLMEMPGQPEEDRRQHLATIKSSALRLKELLHDFFELSLIESGDYPLREELVRLDDAIAEVLAARYDDFQSNGRLPSVHISDNDFTVVADSSAVKRVMENLIINAIKHSTGDIKIMLKRTESHVQLVITNPADSLKASDLSRLFERFYKADQTRKGTGAGLGLFIASHLMQKMKGSLSAVLVDGHLEMTSEWPVSP